MNRDRRAGARGWLVASWVIIIADLPFAASPSSCIWGAKTGFQPGSATAAVWWTTEF
jgi:hypothetical protein